MQFLFQNKKIHYKVNGRGPYLLLLHGFLEDSTIWENLIPALVEEYTVITIDLPGHGTSEVLAEIHSMELMAEVVISLLSDLGIKKVSVMGHSMGGYVALAIAESAPSLLQHILLLNSRAANDSEQQRVNRNRAIALMKTQPSLFIKMGISNLFSEKAQLQFAKEIKDLQLKALQFPAEGITANIKGMRDRKNRSDILKDFEGSKWIIAGREDPVIPFSVSEAMANSCDCAIKILEGSHMGWLENKEQIIQFLHLIDKF